MAKKIVFIGVIAFSIFISSTPIYADQYHLQYAGNCFVPQSDQLSYSKEPTECYLSHNCAQCGYYTCPVNFNVPDGSTYFIKSIGIRYLDNLTDGNIHVYLYRKNLYTGAYHQIATWQSWVGGASSSFQTSNNATKTGYKLIDTKKFSYYLVTYFYNDGCDNPGDNLRLSQVRIHYGT